MVDILSYELSLLSKVDKETLDFKSKSLGLTLQQMKDFLLANGKLPNAKHVQGILNPTQMKVITQLKIVANNGTQRK